MALALGHDNRDFIRNTLLMLAGAGRSRRLGLGEYRAEEGRGRLVSRTSLDPADPIAFGRWLAGLRSAFNDLDAVALDMLRPPRFRELGPAIHARNYTAAREQVLQALDFAAAPEPAPEPGDPAGSGGAGPPH